MQIKLWDKNEAGLKELAKNARGLVSITKLVNFVVAQYLVSKKKPVKVES